MSRLEWDKTGEKKFEMGTDRGVLFVMKDDGTYEKGVAWNGLTGVTDSPDGAEASDFYADNIKYGSVRSAEKYGGTIEAFTYPDAWNECDGRKAVKKGVYIGQQTRRKFAFCWRTKIGNDVTDELGYKIHIAYGCSASPSEKSYETINDSPDMMTMSWEFEANPVNVTDGKPSASLEIDSTALSAGDLKKIEDKLYGSAEGEATLLLPDEVAALITAA